MLQTDNKYLAMQNEIETLQREINKTRKQVEDNYIKTKTILKNLGLWDLN